MTFLFLIQQLHPERRLLWVINTFIVTQIIFIRYDQGLGVRRVTWPYIALSKRVTWADLFLSHLSQWLKKMINITTVLPIMDYFLNT